MIGLNFFSVLASAILTNTIALILVVMIIVLVMLSTIVTQVARLFVHFLCFGTSRNVIFAMLTRIAIRTLLTVFIALPGTAL